MAYLPMGLLVGNSAGSIRIFVENRPPAPDNSKFKKGDMCIKRDSAAWEGWRYDSAGAGSWLPF